MRVKDGRRNTKVIIGVPKEVKVAERRVALTPTGIRTLVGNGHRVLLQCGAGLGSGLPDEMYLRAGAETVS
jgi:alanine dehydrogenase